MKTCQQCGEQFEVSEKDRAFYAKLSLGVGKQEGFIPEPVRCFACRDQDRLVFRNERYYYPSSCDLCQKKIISVYNPEYVKNVYCHECWWSDNWDPKQYGRDFDFGKPFFEQYKELLAEVPKLAMMNDNGTGSQNSEYTYDAAYNKNAYLVIASWHVEDGMYGWQTNHVKNCVDNSYVRESELMYNSLFCEKCYGCQDCVQCTQSADCIFGFDLKGCKDCLFSAGLRQKQYYIWNKPYSKEEYFQKKKELGLDCYEKREKYRKEFAEFLQSVPRQYGNFINSENCTGDNLWNSKDAEECYNFWGLHGCKWMSNGDGAKDCYDCYSTGGPELCYNSVTPDHSYGAIFSVYCWKSQYIAYSDNCHSCENLLGCVGMKRSKFCIFNKQYSEEEYRALYDKIVEHMRGTGEWGEFFRPDVTLFAYNETTAYEAHPLSEEEAGRRGYRWQKVLPGSFSKETVQWKEVPDCITDIAADGAFGDGKNVLKEVFPCVNCGRNFKILEGELKFYRQGGVPLPRLCVDCRYNRRRSLMNPRKLYDRACAQCGAAFKTTYGPDRPEKVYCEKCYLKEVR